MRSTLLGVAATPTLRRHVAALQASTARRHGPAPGGEKLRRYREFHDGAASGSRVERIRARLEAGTARTIYEDLCCRRGQAENHIKAWENHLAADRTSCCRAAANQFRLMPHTGA